MKVTTFTPEPTASKYADDIAALIKATDADPTAAGVFEFEYEPGKKDKDGNTIPATEQVITSRRAVQDAARAADRTARAVQVEVNEAAKTVDITFILTPKRKGRGASKDEADAE